MSQVLSVKEWFDMHAYVRFDPSVFATPPDPQRPTPFKGGIVRSGTRFHGRVALDHRECIVNRVWASIDGERDEAADLAARTTIKVMINQMPVCERPLDAIWVNNVDHRVDERLGRLERMMNVLVEQDSPAGEALRRLGGAKVEGGSLLSINPPHVVKLTDQVEIVAIVDDDVLFENAAPIIKVSVGGIFSREVL